jgi:hypothetical protein
MVMEEADETSASDPRRIDNLTKAAAMVVVFWLMMADELSVSLVQVVVLL